MPQNGSRTYRTYAIAALMLAGASIAPTLYRASYQSDRDDVVALLAMAIILAALALRRIIAPQRQS